jgi:hypothetical protein
MRRGISFGLVGGGSVGRSFLAKHPWLEAGLGPVTASRFRLASRIANTLRAGYAVNGPAELKDCRTILVAVPDHQIDAAARRIAPAIEWRSRHVIRCQGSSCGLSLLRDRGAECASLSAIEGVEEWFAVEGDVRARRTACLFAEAAGGRVVEIRHGQVPAFEAGLAFAGDLLAPLIEAARRCFTAAGIHESTARKLAEAVAERALRSPFTPGETPLATDRRASGAREAGLERFYLDTIAGIDGTFRNRSKPRASKPRPGGTT